MKKLYRKLFPAAEQEKVPERKMITRAILTVAVILVCLTGMTLTAYAYFSLSVVSGQASITSACFDAEVTVSGGITVAGDGDYAVKATVPKGTYQITIDESANSTARTGFVTIAAHGTDKVYHTQQLGQDQAAPGGFTDQLVFDLQVTDDTTLCFTFYWGTSVYYADYANTGNGGETYITNSHTGADKVVMIINGVPATVQEEEEQTPDQSETETETVHTVSEGQTLEQVAALYGITLDQLMAYNGLTDAQADYAGQQLSIPAAVENASGSEQEEQEEQEEQTGSTGQEQTPPAEEETEQPENTDVGEQENVTEMPTEENGESADETV